MSLNYQPEDAARALDQQQALDRLRGFAVSDPAGGSNIVTATNSDHVVDVAGGDVLFNGSVVSCPNQQINFVSNVTSQGKFALIYRDGNGDVQTEITNGESTVSNPETRKQTRPPVPTLEATNAVVLAEVFLRPGADDVLSSDIRDRRVPESVSVGDIAAQSGSIQDAPTAATDIARQQEISDTETFAANEVDDHQQNEVHAQAQPPQDHSTDHESGGADEIDVTGLTGDLADAQDPKTHASTHESGGADELSLTIAGNLAVLGTSTAIAHGDLSTAPANAHHAEPSAGTAITDEGTNQFGLDTSTSVSFPNGIDSLPSPTADGDAARKSYVDAIEQGLDIKDAVRAATDGANVDLSSSTDPNPIDGVTLSDGDRVLLKDQTTGSENGLYNAATATDPTTWTRTDDADEDSEVTSGLFVFVAEGNRNDNRGFVLTTDDPIAVGTDALAFTQFSGAGQIQAGTLLEKVDDTLNVLQGDISHDAIDQTTVDSADHHSKTTSASELTDVSPDSDANAHHQDPSAGTALTDEGTNQFGVADSGIGATQLADGSVTAAKTATQKLSYSPGVTEFEDGKTNTEIFREELAAGESLVVERVSLALQGGGSSSNIEIRVRDVTAATTIATVTAGSVTKDPGSTGSGNTVVVEYSNSSGANEGADPTVIGQITGV